MKALVILATLAATPAHAASYDLVTACTATLSVISGDPGNQDIKLTSQSQPYVGSVEGFGQSDIQVPMGDYTLIAGMAEMGDAQIPMQPMLAVELFKGDPVAGQVNYARLGGLDLDDRPAGVPLTVTGMAFVQTTVNGQNVSRIDYTCSVTKQ